MRQVEDAQRNGWVVVSDTSWELTFRAGMLGYTTMFSEARAACRGDRQADAPLYAAGVGAVRVRDGFYSALFGAGDPYAVVVEPDLAACLYQSTRRLTASHAFPATEHDHGWLACGEPSPLAWTLRTASTCSSSAQTTSRRRMRVYGMPAGDPLIVSGNGRRDARRADVHHGTARTRRLRDGWTSTKTRKCCSSTPRQHRSTTSAASWDGADRFPTSTR